MIDSLVRRAGLSTGILLLAMLAAFAYRPVVRNLSTPVELFLAPADAAAIVFVPSILELGENLHSHLCNFDRTDPTACPFISDKSKKSDTLFSVYNQLFLLDAYGVDLRRPAMAAWRGPATAGDFIVVLSLQSSTQACESMTSYLKADPSESSPRIFSFSEGGLCPVLANDQANGSGVASNGLRIFAKTLDAGFGEDRKLLVFYTNAPAFKSMLEERNGGEHLLSQDGFAEAYATLVQNQRAAIWGFARQPGLTPLAPSAFALTFVDADKKFMPDETRKEGLDALRQVLNSSAESSKIDPAMAKKATEDLVRSADFVTGAKSVRLSTWLAPSVLYSRNFSGLLATAPGDDVASGLESGAGLSLRARTLMEFVRFADYAFPATLPTFLFHGQDATLGSQASIFESLLRETMRLESVEGIDAQLVGFRDRIPNLVLRISMNEAEASRLIARIQASEQKRRDIALVNAALNQKAETAIVLSQAQALVQKGVIQTASVPGAMKHLLEAKPDEAAFEAAVAGDPQNTGCLAPQPAGAPAAACPEAQRFVYLQPPLNGNDVDIRLADSASKEAVRASLLVDQRFRAVAIFDRASKTLWVASDKDVLAQHLARAATALPASHAWFRMSIQPDNLYAQMKAQEFDDQSGSNEAHLAEFIRNMSVYDHMTMSAESLGDNRGTRIDLELSR